MAGYDGTKLVLVFQDIGNQGSAIWAYRGVDATTTVDGSGYITDAKKRGMKKNDIVNYIKTDDSPISGGTFLVDAINTDGSADLSNVTAFTATNSD